LHVFSFSVGILANVYTENKRINELNWQ